MKTWITIFIAAFISSSAFAEGLFRADFGYVMDDTKSSNSTSKNTRQLIDLAGGYLWQESGWTVLGQYAMEKTTSESGGATTEGNRTSYGPGVGWISRQPVGMYVTAAYYISSKYALSGTTFEGSGYQVDLGLRVDLSKIYLLAGMSYEAFNYTKANGQATTYKQSHIDPRIGLQLEF